MMEETGWKDSGSLAFPSAQLYPPFPWTLATLWVPTAQLPAQSQQAYRPATSTASLTCPLLLKPWEGLPLKTLVPTWVLFWALSFLRWFL